MSIDEENLIVFVNLGYTVAILFIIALVIALLAILLAVLRRVYRTVLIINQSKLDDAEEDGSVQMLKISKLEEKGEQEHAQLGSEKKGPESSKLLERSSSESEQSEESGEYDPNLPIDKDENIDTSENTSMDVSKPEEFSKGKLDESLFGKMKITGTSETSGEKLQIVTVVDVEPAKDTSTGTSDEKATELKASESKKPEITQSDTAVKLETESTTAKSDLTKLLEKMQTKEGEETMKTETKDDSKNNEEAAEKKTGDLSTTDVTDVSKEKLSVIQMREKIDSSETKMSTVGTTPTKQPKDEQESGQKVEIPLSDIKPAEIVPVTSSAKETAH